MKKRIIRNIYFTEDIKYVNHQHVMVHNSDGTLFSNRHKTSIRPEDLPEWFLYGRYYKRFGYMSAKGIVDMVYVPTRIGTFLKDDILFVSYNEKITQITPPVDQFIHTAFDEHTGFDLTVNGLEICNMLKGAREYSGFDITPIIEQIKERFAWLKEHYAYDYANYNWDADKFFSTGIDEWCRKR